MTSAVKIMTLAQNDFTYLSDLIRKRSGISLKEDKMYLLESRLLPISKKMGCNNLSEFVNKIRSKPDEAVFTQVTEAMTTNETYFFRDTSPFEKFRQVMLPHLTKHVKEKRKIRIWSAACSTGQEAYSLAISILEEQTKYPNLEFDIVGTDIAENVLEKAKNGVYSQFEVQRGMPITLLVKYFKQQGETWQVNDKIRSMVKFSKLNLLESYAAMGIFDIVFCRNVLIYFEMETKAVILDKISKLMYPHSLLLLGGSETTYGISDKFQTLEIQGSNTKGIYCLHKK